MDDLVELVHIIHQGGTRPIGAFNPQKGGGSKISQLYFLILEGKVASDEEAIKLLYPDSTSRNAYYNLKYKLRNKLLDSLFFVDVNGSSDRQEAFFDAQKKYATVQILMAKNSYSPAISILKSLLQQCQFFEFSDLVLMITRLLCMHYSTRVGDVKRYGHYKKIQDEYERIQSKEIRVEKHYASLVLQFVNDKSAKPYLEQKAIECLVDLEEEKRSVGSYKFNLYYYLIKLFRHTCTNDYVDALPVCEEMIGFFETKPFIALTPLQICRNHQLVAYLQLKNYDKARHVAEMSKLLNQEGTFNWFSNLEYLFLLSMHTFSFEGAYGAYRAAVLHERYKFLPMHVQEIWEIYEAYLCFVIEFWDVEVEDRQLYSFRIQRFVNSIPIFSKDKEGMNIAILIVQILFYIHRKKYDETLNRIEAIEKYCSRYLMKPTSVRSYYFIKLLLTIPQADFHPVAVKRHAANYWKKLTEHEKKFDQQFHKIEVIPYEFLWERVLLVLEKNQS